MSQALSHFSNITWQCITEYYHKLHNVNAVFNIRIQNKFTPTSASEIHRFILKDVSIPDATVVSIRIMLCSVYCNKALHCNITTIITMISQQS